MNNDGNDACILNAGAGAWAFAALAERLSKLLQLPISETPRSRNYLLFHDAPESLVGESLFVPLPSVRLAGDKRELARTFAKSSVVTPRTHLIDTSPEVDAFVEKESDREWCLKYPTSCGAGGHRLIDESMILPPEWPRPFVVQEFIRMERPSVHRAFCAGGELFGWVERSFSAEVEPTPWVAHARGARYNCFKNPPAAAAETARAALIATGLWDSFGCADLLEGPDGQWLVLEVGTDGLVNHVDRAFDDREFEDFLAEKLSGAVQRWLGSSSAT